MPIYEYQCDSCGARLEVIQAMSEPPRRDCPNCSTPALRKLVSATGFRLKGTGWYATDFKNQGHPTTSEGSKGSDQDTQAGASDSAKEDTKSKPIPPPKTGGAAPSGD